MTVDIDFDQNKYPRAKVWLEAKHIDLYDIEKDAIAVATFFMDLAKEHPGCRIRRESDYDGDPYLAIEVERFEEDGEYKRRVNSLIQRQKAIDERDRLEFERLQKKFGNT